MSPKEKKNFDVIPRVMQARLSAKELTPIQAQKKRIVLGYSSHVKLKAVVRWKERMARAGLNNNKLAGMLDVPPSRISEWLNFTWEVQEDTFLKIEKILYKLGV